MIRNQAVDLKPLMSATPDLAEAGTWFDRQDAAMPARSS